MAKHTDQDIEQFIEDLDTVIFQYQNVFESHNLAGMLLSRVTHLMTMDPSVGKQLLMHVWHQLDTIESADPGSMIP